MMSKLPTYKRLGHSIRCVAYLLAAPGVSAIRIGACIPQVRPLLEGDHAWIVLGEEQVDVKSFREFMWNKRRNECLLLK
jgi:hypothetical protein